MKLFQDSEDVVRQIANWYRDGLPGLPLRFQDEAGDVVHSYWMCCNCIRNFLAGQGERQ